MSKLNYGQAYLNNMYDAAKKQVPTNFLQILITAKSIIWFLHKKIGKVEVKFVNEKFQNFYFSKKNQIYSTP